MPKIEYARVIASLSGQRDLAPKLGDIVKAYRSGRINFGSTSERVELACLIGYRALTQSPQPDVKLGKEFVRVALTLLFRVEEEGFQRRLQNYLAFQIVLLRDYSPKARRDFPPIIAKFAENKIIDFNFCIACFDLLAHDPEKSPENFQRQIDFTRRARELAETPHQQVRSAYALFQRLRRAVRYGLPADQSEARRAAEALVAFYPAARAQSSGVERENLEDFAVWATVVIDLHYFEMTDLLRRFVQENNHTDHPSIALLLRYLAELPTADRSTLTRLFDAEIERQKSGAVDVITQECCALVQKTLQRSLAAEARPWAEALPRIAVPEVLRLVSSPVAPIDRLRALTLKPLLLALNNFAGQLPDHAVASIRLATESGNLFLIRGEKAADPFNLFLSGPDHVYQATIRRRARHPEQWLLGRDGGWQPLGKVPLEELLPLAKLLILLLPKTGSEGITTLERELVKLEVSDKLDRNRILIKGLVEAIERDERYVAAHETVMSTLDQIFNIFARLSPRIPSAAARVDLQPDDPLAEYLLRITLIPPPAATTALEEFFGELVRAEISFLPGHEPWLVFFTLRDGQNGCLAVPSLDRLTLPNKVEPLTGLAADFLKEIVLATLIRIWAESENIQMTPSPAYLIDSDESGNPMPGIRRRLQLLQELYESQFRQLLDRRGILAFDFIRRQTIAGEEYFVPLPDQSAAAKVAALAGPARDALFISAEPRGHLVRLPVRKKRGSGLGIDSWRPTAVALKQKELMGDQRPLPQQYALYLLTHIDRNRTIVLPLIFKDSEEEILDGRLWAPYEERLRRGRYRDPAFLLHQVSPEKRAEYGKLLAESPEAKQEIEVFQAFFTYRRPHYLSVADLLEKGVPLKTEET
ncbi:hypothetical protein A2625_06755 [candidate division WOR-1 bacterium RIFCSPHIGHO2_01_FULL_53_15]|uniref:Uncharacterized protein n=1 Tax=candidate division WOR-1 bacterium RIFCSPHIGHO2_01_FULL_53_15 TaxID=1802564 RepID=A0A1F4Q556_UNCSA|nr:MAG: hypothetical protein A2625_06755 [candidate division WOR-1 bacterium RIFCSPHIGHO2_01_FULL_53_15]OGC10304.1 MAG: hypothetical protein A3D23_06760 [candidate division WOR-1 bacterium RIFCSPHIGHO2_02_FULL_53_26]